MCDVVKEYANKSVVEALNNLVNKGKLQKNDAVEQSGLSAAKFDAIVAELATANN